MDPAAAANFGDDGYPDRATRYRRADEFARVVSALWTSWPADLDQPWDAARLERRPVDHHGEFFDVAGPMQLPLPGRDGRSSSRPAARTRSACTAAATPARPCATTSASTAA
jgi:alkanesulfonate monooxygenase SsuD/methylene tetrahydromethanopterin reductase-like flavin-dependent oxidoreductase (luciferase family)